MRGASPSSTLVTIDAGTKRVVSRTSLQLQGSIVAFASAANRIVVLACRNSATRLVVGDSSGAPLADLTTGLPCRIGGGSAVAVRADGSEVSIVAGDGSISTIDLEARPLRLRRLPAALGTPRAANTLSAVTWVGRSLAITAATDSVALGRTSSYVRGRGVGLVDPQLGTRRVLTLHGSRLLVIGDVLIVSGFDETVDRPAAQ